MFIAIIRTWDYIYVTLLWELYGAVPAHNTCIHELYGAVPAHSTCIHELNASPCPSKCEFKAMPFSVQQYSDNFSI
jgi:hypothetical protein